MYSLVPGGAERLVVDLTNELALNNDVKLFVFRDAITAKKSFYKSDINKKVNYVNLKIKEGFKPHLNWTFYKLLKREQPDIVHCHLNLICYFFLSSILLHKRIRFIYTIHTTAENEIVNKFEGSIRRFFFQRNFILPVAVSNETKKSYEAYYKLQNAHIIYNGRDTVYKSAKYEEVVKEINALKPTSSTLVFCHVGRYCKQKNHEMLVSVFNSLRKDNYDIILLIIGFGLDTADELTTAAEKHIHFLGLKKNTEDYLYASDAFCLSSISEGMPITLLEALACGCIPICTPVGGSIDLIKEGETGFLSRTVSEEDYLDAVIRFINHGREIDKKKLVNYYDENFTIEQCAREYMKLYTSNQTANQEDDTKT